MPTLRLTQVAIDRLAPPKAGRIEFFDSVLPGFGLRISDNGHKAWVLFYRLGGRQRRYTLGSLATYPEVAVARDRARHLLQRVEQGIDPAAEKVARPERQPDTIETLAEQFVARYCKPKNRSWRTTEAVLRLHVLSRWAGRDAASIGRRDVLELLDDLVDRGHPIVANRVLAAVRKMFGWAVERDILLASPVTNVKAPGKEVERERVLSDEELSKLWNAATKAGGVAGGFFRMLMLTAQRRDEVATMRWADLNLEANIWTLPREATKGDRSHEVPLASCGVAILLALPRCGEFVFTSTRGAWPISGYSKMKAAIAKAAAVEDWRIHDLRRTAGTGMARCGIAVSTISRVLNHKEGGVTKIYNRYSYLDEKRAALEAWARKVESLAQEPAATVLQP